jgi:ketosteroid isomerase-like protein
VTADPAVDLIERYVGVVNGGDLARLEALFAPDFVHHRPTGTEVGVAPLRAFVESVRRVLPD